MAFCGEMPEMVAMEGAVGDIYLGFWFLMSSPIA